MSSEQYTLAQITEEIKAKMNLEGNTSNQYSYPNETLKISSTKKLTGNVKESITKEEKFKLWLQMNQINYKLKNPILFSYANPIS